MSWRQCSRIIRLSGSDPVERFPDPSFTYSGVRCFRTPTPLPTPLCGRNHRSFRSARGPRTVLNPLEIFSAEEASSPLKQPVEESHSIASAPQLRQSAPCDIRSSQHTFRRLQAQGYCRSRYCIRRVTLDAEALLEIYG